MATEVAVTNVARGQETTTMTAIAGDRYLLHLLDDDSDDDDDDDDDMCCTVHSYILLRLGLTEKPPFPMIFASIIIKRYHFRFQTRDI
jgi:hypothetical protein